MSIETNEAGAKAAVDEYLGLHRKIVGLCDENEKLRRAVVDLNYVADKKIDEADFLRAENKVLRGERDAVRAGYDRYKAAADALGADCVKLTASEIDLRMTCKELDARIEAHKVEAVGLRLENVRLKEDAKGRCGPAPDLGGCILIPPTRPLSGAVPYSWVKFSEIASLHAENAKLNEENERLSRCDRVDPATASPRWMFCSANPTVISINGEKYEPIKPEALASLRRKIHDLEAAKALMGGVIEDMKAARVRMEGVVTGLRKMIDEATGCPWLSPYRADEARKQDLEKMRSDLASGCLTGGPIGKDSARLCGIASAFNRLCLGRHGSWDLHISWQSADAFREAIDKYMASRP